MTENLVPTVRTTPTMRDFAAALLEAWPDATKAGAGVLWAHFAGETGDGLYCWNWDLGNVKHSRGDGHDYVSLANVWEGFAVGDENHDGAVDAADRVLLVNRLLHTGLWLADPSADHAKAVGPGKVSLIATSANSATWFRAYASLAAGMAEFVASKRDGHWSSTWAFVIAGDPKGYALELGRLHYYTASPTAYAAALAAKHAGWMSSPAFDDALSARSPAVTPDQLEPEPAIVHPDVELGEPEPTEV